jgi:hypothetical protein
MRQGAAATITWRARMVSGFRTEPALTTQPRQPPDGRRGSWVVIVVALVGSAAGAGLAYAAGVLDADAVGYFVAFNAVVLLLFRPRRYPGRL